MSENLLFEPLKYYERAKREHQNNIDEYFDRLKEQAKVDHALNKKTVAEYDKQVSITKKLSERIAKKRVWKVVLIVLSVLLVIASIGTAMMIEDGTLRVICPIACVLLIVLFIALTISISKKKKALEGKFLEEKKKEEQLLEKAYAEVQSLNRLFSEKDTFRLIEKVFPNLRFSDNYHTDLSENFNRNFNFLNEIDDNRSVINTLSGTFNDNPFVFYRYFNHYMGEKTYQGSMVIHWTTMSRDSDGRLRRVTHTQTLYASVSKPYPYYDYKTALAYGNQSGPDLCFSRTCSHSEMLSKKELEKKIKKGEKKLREFSEKATNEGKNFTELANTDFEVLFGAFDRNDEVEYRLIFSPLAQKNMEELLTSKVGYGDDFKFVKKGKFNRIESEHAQFWDVSTSPDKYYSYDLDKIKENFTRVNQEYFKNLFFDFAPLLAIPTYHDQPNIIFEPLGEDFANYSSFEHEVMVNAIGKEHFKNLDSRSDVILKTNYIGRENNTDKVRVTAKSYLGENRVDFVPTLGGDGRIHNVPVPWVEYIPVEKVTDVGIKEIGILKDEFRLRVTDEKGANTVYSSPSAYYHGLFAKILDGETLTHFDGELEKIVKEKKEEKTREHIFSEVAKAVAITEIIEEKQNEENERKGE